MRTMFKRRRKFILKKSLDRFIIQSFLMVGYATIYTQLPVFSLVLDKDVTPKIAMDFPELYKELTKGECQTLRVGTIWKYRIL